VTDRIAIDAMGGDYGPSAIVPATESVIRKYSDLSIILVGRENILVEELEKIGLNGHPRIKTLFTDEAVYMDELPSLALRNKKRSSMRLAIELVRDNEVDACVSAGNTGALMAISRYVLKMLPGIDRPAICSAMPCPIGQTHFLDLGANINSSSEQLFQFALMGSELTCALDNIERPTVGLLNVGSEEIKGDDRIKQASLLLSNSYLNYIGFVEGTDIFTGNVDVIVSDGFSGNIALKASEGVAELVKYHVKNEFSQHWYAKLVAIAAMPVLNQIRKKIDPRRYNGASLLGLRGIVVKSHGSADSLSFKSAIEVARLEVTKNIPKRISRRLEEVSNGIIN
jgi:glycerol-3-phosphate acyltransferase PlsX